MPGYKKTSKYSLEKTAELTTCALGVLEDSRNAMTIDEICQADMALTGQTTQKMARVLNHLVEAGFVKKTKSKAGKMLYMSVTQLAEQGYDVDNIVC